MQDEKSFDMTTEYDRSFVKAIPDIDNLLEGYMASHTDRRTSLFDEDKDDEIEGYIEQINDIVTQNPEKAVTAESDNAGLASDTKEFYKLSSFKFVPKTEKKTPPPEIKLTGKKARISSVKEFVQTVFPGLESNDDDGQNKIFVVTMPEEKEKKTSQDTAELEKIVEDDGEINHKELARFLKDDIFAVISTKIKEMREEYRLGIHPLDKIKDKNEIRDRLSKSIAVGRKRLIVMGFVFVLLLYLGISQSLKVPFIQAISYVHGNNWFMLINVLLAMPMLICAKDLYKEAFKQIFCATPGIETALTFFASVSVLHTLLLVFNRSDGAYTYLSLTAMTLLGYIYYDTENYKKMRADYKLIAFKPVKTCGRVLSDKQLTQEITGDDSLVATVRKYDTIVTDDFFTKSTQRASESKVLSVLSVVSIALSLILFVLTLILEGKFISAVTMVVVTLALTVSVVLCVTNMLPYISFSKKLKFSGAAITGEYTAKNFAKAETLVLCDQDLFPPKSLLLCGSKLYNDTDMKTMIIDVASVLNSVNSPLTGMMMDIISGQTEILKDTDSVNYYDEKGISAYVENAKVLIGNRAFMRDNLIKIPADGTQEKIESGGKVALFVAINGFLAAIFSIKYNENQIIKKRVKKLIGAGVGFAVKSRDPNLTRSLVCGKYDIPESMIRILPVSLSEKEELLRIEDHTPDVITITKDVSAFFRAHTTAHKMRSSLTTNTAICLAAYVFGVVLAVAACVMSMLPAAKPILIVLLQLFWLIPPFVTTVSLNKTI